MITFAVAVAIAPAFLAALLVALLQRSKLATHLIDIPNERSLHSDPRPRVGGLAVMASALPIAAWAAQGTLRPALLAAGALCVLSAVDDWRSLPAAVRLAAHALAAGVVLFLMGPIHAALVLFLLVAIVWMTNLYNFMDGADGLAGGMGAIGFGALALGAAFAGDALLAGACAAIASACVGFLAFNFPPARVFLGDSGSVPLGFLAAVLGLHGLQAGIWPAWFPVLVFSPFIVDASVTLLRRLFAGESVWRAHRSHYYQRLLLSGWSKRRLAAVQYAWMVACATSALAAREAGLMLQCGILVVWSLGYLFVIVALDSRLAAPALAKK